MKFSIIAALLFAVGLAQATPNVDINGRDQNILDVIESYSKQTGQKFIVDPSVKGKVSILAQKPATAREAYEDLSTALAANGYAISKRNDQNVVMSARNIQRSWIEVTEARPTAKPERMVSWVYQFKNISAAEVNRNLRIFPSKDGEVAVEEQTNQMIFTDWSSNMQRIAEVLEKIDRAASK